MPPDFSLEEKLAADMIVCGIDEVGRGPWAGPVCAACVVIPEQHKQAIAALGLRDSKKLTAAKRLEFADFIKSNCHYAISFATVEEIDTLNIRQATFLAMRRSFDETTESLGCSPDFALIDGRDSIDLPCPVLSVIGGDDISLSISAASIIAKVARDELMTELHRDYPAFCWDRNSGYGVPAHREALKKHGVTPHHRKSFAPIRKALDPLHAVSGRDV